ncbi:unnamed protein product, partial [Didymodactylos carnosus]
MAKQSDDKVNTNTILDKLQAKECRTKNSNSDVLPVSKPTDKAKTPVIEKKDLELLKKFDLNMDFGPCTGITRLERFNRAMKHSLDPPSRVQELIDMYPNSKEVTHWGPERSVPFKTDSLARINNDSLI